MPILQPESSIAEYINISITDRHVVYAAMVGLFVFLGRAYGVIFSWKTDRMTKTALNKKFKYGWTKNSTYHENYLPISLTSPEIACFA
jgi:hypothetical protein